MDYSKNSSLIPHEGRLLSFDSMRSFLRDLETATSVGDALRPYRLNPAAFVSDLIQFPEGEKPTKYQIEVLEELPVQKRIAGRGPHGLGKTALASWIVLWAVMTSDDVKVPTTASAWRQLEKFLWPEIHKWAARLKWDKLDRDPFSGNELLTLNIKLGATRTAYAIASDRAALIEGTQAGDRVCFVFDEAKTIPADIWDAAEGAGSGVDKYSVAISTPAEPSGRFYEIHARRPGYEDWWVRHVTLDEAIKAGRIRPDWAKDRKRQWGVKSPIYQNRVLGEFATSSADNVVIPLSWIEKANERWLEWNDAGDWIEIHGDPVPIQITKEGEFRTDEDGIPIPEKLKTIGVDVGRGGDLSVLAPRIGFLVPYLRESGERDIMAIVGAVVTQIARYRGSGVPVVDVIGIGSGVVDRLREMVHSEDDFPADPETWSVEAFNASGKTTRTDITGELRFLNKRAAAWWAVRELLDPETGEDVALPPDDLLIGDLAAPTWKTTSAGRIKIESKDELKKRIGRSTNHGDAVVMAFFGPELEGELFV